MRLRNNAFRFLAATIILSAIFAISPFPGTCQDNSTSKKDGSKTRTSSSESDLIRDVIRANYKAMEEKASNTVLSMYHPNTNLRSSKAELDNFFSQMDVKYKIDNIRFIGSDGENFVAIYHEYTEFRRRAPKNSEVVDKEDTDVLMVFRKHDSEFKIFTSRSLKPGN